MFCLGAAARGGDSGGVSGLLKPNSVPLGPLSTKSPKPNCRKHIAMFSIVYRSSSLRSTMVDI